MRIALVVLFLALVDLLAQQGPVTWKGQPGLDALRAEAPAAAELATKWLPFAEAHGYRLVFDDDVRVLLVLGPRFARKQADRESLPTTKMLELVRATAKIVEPLVGFAGKEQPPPVLIAARAADYEGLLRHVAVLDPRLQAWATGAGQLVTGFILSEPLVAAWVEDGKGLEEWNQHNELVHRTAQMLLRRRTDQVPPWFAVGFGWHVEETVLQKIWCFPYRAGFVWATEHTGWEQRLATRFKKAAKGATAVVPTLDGLAVWKPTARDAAFDTEMAHLAFGLVRFLASEHATSFTAMAHRFDDEIEAKWKVWINANEWRTDPEYRIPAARQLELLEIAVPDFLASAATFFQRPRGKTKEPTGRKR